MFVEIALRLVEGDLRQHAGVNRLDEFCASHAAVLQMRGARFGAGRELREIVERLVVELEIRHRLAVRTIQRCLPGAGIPGPDTPFALSRSPMVFSCLRRQRVRLRRIGKTRVAVLRRLVVARLIGRLHGVDGVEIRRDLPSWTNFGMPSIADFGELGASVSDTPSASTDAIKPLAGLLSASGYCGDAGADQLEMIEERAAEGAHEEIIGQARISGRRSTAAAWSRHSGP